MRMAEVGPRSHRFGEIIYITFGSDSSYNRQVKRVSWLGDVQTNELLRRSGKFDSNLHDRIAGS